jgi:hypothetical protein
MRGWRGFIFTLAGALLTALPAYGADKTDAAATAAARNQALIAFQRDLVSVLAPRADAMPLLAAALLARTLPDPPRYSDFHTLISRAAALPGHDPAVDWLRLSDCDERGGDCPNAEALAALTTEAADNAAVWLLKLGQDLHDLKKDQARADLSRAAAAKLYDDYTGVSLQALASYVTLLPPPANVLGPQGGAAGTQVMLVLGVAGMQPQPGLQVTAKLCEQGAGDADVRADCLKLGKLLEWGSSPLARSLGLHLRETLDTDPARQEDARRARRDLVWQVHNFAALSARAPTDAVQAQRLLALARNGGIEMSVVLAALRERGIPVEAPADWQPPPQADEVEPK